MASILFIGTKRKAESFWGLLQNFSSIRIFFF